MQRRFTVNELTAEISDDEFLSLEGAVPLEIQIRQKLNKQGIKFKDDGRASAAINCSPEPLGTLTAWKDHDKRRTFFRQVIAP